MQEEQGNAPPKVVRKRQLDRSSRPEGGNILLGGWEGGRGGGVRLSRDSRNCCCVI